MAAERLVHAGFRTVLMDEKMEWEKSCGGGVTCKAVNPTVAVPGGGPAGSMAAERLAHAGFRTLLIDEKMAWQKPRGAKP